MASFTCHVLCVTKRLRLERIVRCHPSTRHLEEFPSLRGIGNGHRLLELVHLLDSSAPPHGTYPPLLRLSTRRRPDRKLLRLSASSRSCAARGSLPSARSQSGQARIRYVEVSGQDRSHRLRPVR